MNVNINKKTEINTLEENVYVINEPIKNNFSFYKEIKILKSLIKQEKEKDTIDENKIQLLERQLEEVREIHAIYKIYKRNTYTQNSQNRLNILFAGIEGKIGNIKQEIVNDAKKIKTILKNEVQRLSDTIEDNTYRDHIEQNIDFLNIYKDKIGLETEDTNKFLRSFTIKYIDFIEKCNRSKQKPNRNEKLDISLSELQKIIIEVFREIGRIPKDLRKIEFQLKSSKKVTIDIYSLLSTQENTIDTILLEKEQIKDVQEKLQKLGYYHLVVDGKYENMKQSIIAYQELHDIIPRGGRLGKGDFGIKTKLHLEKEYEIYLEAQNNFTGEISTKLLKQEKKSNFLLGEFLRDNKNRLPEEAEKIFLHCLVRYKVFDKKYVEKNKEILSKRIGILLRFILSIESGENKLLPWFGKEGGKLKAKNKHSSAKGSFQILNGFIKGIMIIKRSSFITKLNRVNRYYKEEKPKWFNLIYENVKKNEKLKPGDESELIVSPLDLTAEQSIILWMVDLFETPGTNIHIKQVLMGNQWSMRRIYEDIHHTSTKKITNKKTEKLTTKKIWFFGGELRRSIKNK